MWDACWSFFVSKLFNSLKRWWNWNLKLVAFCWIFLASFRFLAHQVDFTLSHLMSFYTFLSTNFNIFNAKCHPLWTLKWHSKNFVFSKKHFSILSLFNTLKTLWADLIDSWQMNQLRHREVHDDGREISQVSLGFLDHSVIWLCDFLIRCLHKPPCHLHHCSHQLHYLQCWTQVGGPSFWKIADCVEPYGCIPKPAIASPLASGRVENHSQVSVNDLVLFQIVPGFYDLNSFVWHNSVKGLNI